MIRLVEHHSPLLFSMEGNPVIAAQIQAQARVAGEGILREFWVGLTDEGGEIPHSWFCRSGNTVWAASRRGDAAHGGNATQVAADFVRLLAPETAHLDDTLARALADTTRRHPVMVWGNLSRGERMPLPDGVEAARFLPGDPSGVRAVMELHRLAGVVSSGEGWDNLYGELHLRARRGVAAGVILSRDGEEFACGALEAIGEEHAVLSHICVLPGHQKQGAATRVVAVLCQMAFDLGKTPVLCCRERLAGLYEKAGFVRSGAGCRTPGDDKGDLVHD